MSNEQEDWGPWVEHDGKHCPKGQYVHAIAYDGGEWRGIAGMIPGSLEYYHGGWFFDIDNAESDHVFKYRIRKPKGLSILTNILREVEDTAPMRYKERELEPAL